MLKTFFALELLPRKNFERIDNVKLAPASRNLFVDYIKKNYMRNKD